MKNEKQITRTITIITGKEVVADFKAMKFNLIPFTVYDEKDIPENAQDVVEDEALYTMPISDFIRYGKKVDKQ